MSPQRTSRIALAALALALLAGCGDDGEDVVQPSGALSSLSTPAAAATAPAGGSTGSADGAASTTAVDATTAPTSAGSTDAAARGTAAVDPALAEALAPLDGIPQDGLVLGDPAAPRRLHVFVDLQCPFCKEWDQQGLPGVLDDVRAGTLSLELRTLAFIGPDSLRGAEAVQSAAAQDRAWSLATLLYARQGDENSGWLTDDLLREVGAAIPGLDVEALLAGRTAPEVAGELDRTGRHAEQVGVRGTPAFALQEASGPLSQVEPDGLGPDGFDEILGPA